MNKSDGNEVSLVVPVGDAAHLSRVVGTRDEHLRFLRRELQTDIVAQEGGLLVHGREPEARWAADVLNQMVRVVERGGSLTPSDVRYLLRVTRSGQTVETDELLTHTVLVTEKGKRIVPKTLGQTQYVRLMRQYELVFAIGPAGTGKTFLAVATAIAALKEKTVSRIILARPAVEAGERLGFLPGDIYEKVDPYMRPLYDALYDLMEPDRVSRLIERHVIEVIPLAFMRGRTFNDAFIVLDEAQNTTSLQMKMLLTRMGFGSRVVVTGDITQIDLPRSRKSGLVEVQEVLKGVPGVAFVYLTEQDVVRHPLVQKIVLRYDEWEKRNRLSSSGRSERTDE